MPKLFIIANGKNIRKCLRINKLKNILSSKFDVEILLTGKVGDGISLAKQATENNADFIVIAGGDGTINEVVNGVMLSSKEKKPVLGVFPCGTGDDFVKSLQPRPILDAIDEMNLQKVDLLRIKNFNDNNEANVRYCVNIADVGVSALTVKIVNGSAKRLGSALTFFVGAVKSFLKYKPIEVRVIGDDFEYKGKITTVVFANGKYFGGGMAIAPEAEINDGLIDVVIAGEVRLKEFLKYYPQIRKGQKIKHQQVFYYKTRKLRIKPVQSGDFPVEADGEYIGKMPAEVEILSDSLSFLM